MNKDIISNCLKEARLRFAKGTKDREMADLVSSAYNLGKFKNLNNKKENLEKSYNNLLLQQQTSLFISNTQILHHLKMQIESCQKEIEDLKNEIAKDEGDILKNDEQKDVGNAGNPII